MRRFAVVAVLSASVVSALGSGPALSKDAQLSDATLLSLSRRGALVGLDGDGAMAVVKMAVVGADAGARGAGVGRVAKRSNYLTGSDQRRWRRNGRRSIGSATTASIRERHRAALPGGIGVAGRQRRSGRPPHARGATLRAKRPSGYQRIDGVLRRVEGRFVLGSRSRVAFELGSTTGRSGS